MTFVPRSAHDKTDRSRPGKWLDGGAKLADTNIKPATCRWIEGFTHPLEFSCCAPVKPGSSYCPEHHARVWIAPEIKAVIRPSYIDDATFRRKAAAK